MKIFIEFLVVVEFTIVPVFILLFEIWGIHIHIWISKSCTQSNLDLYCVFQFVIDILFWFLLTFVNNLEFFFF